MVLIANHKKLFCECGRPVDYQGKCKVCLFKKRRKEIKVPDGWSTEEIDIILENILYEKIECINEIVPLLQNKTLDELIELLPSLNIRGKTLHVKANCKTCGKEILIKRHDYERAKYHFCSSECNSKDKETRYLGENNHNYTSEIMKCSYCGKDFKVQQNRIKRKANRFGDKFLFCSRECKHKHQSMYYTGEKVGNYEYAHNEENKEEISKNARMAAMAALKKNTKFTIPHKITNCILEDLCLKYENEKVFGYYSCDIYLPDKNLIIEVMGDYYHCLPTKYKYLNDLQETQYNNIKRDKRKHTYIKKYHNINILYLWECDLKNRIGVCASLIDKYVENNGKLDNYHSFNYNNNIELNNEILTPFFELEKEKRPKLA